MEYVQSSNSHHHHPQNYQSATPNCKRWTVSPNLTISPTIGSCSVIILPAKQTYCVKTLTSTFK